ncbi:hypothetical protein M758_3G131700 [Ceratodon purpureus]|nr:hypothetical protein M758_3G131700 [Ceratodon purpureus]
MHIPTKDHKYMNESLELMNKLLKDSIHGWREAVRKGVTSSFGDDLLGCMLSSITSESWDPNSLEFNLSTVMNNCKLFYFAGQDTVVNGSLFTLLDAHAGSPP